MKYFTIGTMLQVAILCAFVSFIVVSAFSGENDQTTQHRLEFGSYTTGEALMYEQGDSVHTIKLDSISAMIWTKDGTRNTIYYSGGTLSNEITMEEWATKWKEYDTYLKTHTSGRLLIPYWVESTKELNK